LQVLRAAQPSRVKIIYDNPKHAAEEVRSARSKSLARFCVFSSLCKTDEFLGVTSDKRVYRM
jgi:hypothetical protein